MNSRKAMGVRLGWGLADQATSSLTNFAAGLIAARSLPPSEFGSFAIVFSVYVLVLSLCRTISTDPLVVYFSAAPERDWRRGTASATGVAICLGVASGGLCLLAAKAVDSSIGTGLIALGVTLPGLLFQDAWRYAFFAGGRGSKAFLNDLTWGLLLLIWIGFLFSRDLLSVGQLVLGWGITGSIAGVIAAVHGGVTPAPAQSLEWLRRHREFVMRYLGESGVVMVANQLVIVSIAAFGGLAEAGAFRAGQLLFGPLNILFQSSTLVAVPEGARLLSVSTDRLKTFCTLFAASFALTGVLAGVLAWSLPASVGTSILGENWDAARRLVLALTVGSVGAAFYTGAGVGLKSMAAAHLALRSRLIVAPLSLVAATIGAAYLGAYGAVWGMSIVGIAGSFVWWSNFSRALNQHDHRARVAIRNANPTTALQLDDAPISGHPTP